MTGKSLDERISILEKEVRVVAGVVAANTDDLLRTQFVLKELEDAGVLPSLPWDLGSKIVDIYHLIEAKKAGDTETADGVPIDSAIRQLQAEITQLRADFIARVDAQIRG